MLHSALEMVVRNQYDRLATIYDQRWQWYITSTLSFLNDWATIHPNDRLLDVACGTGEFERLVLQDFPQIEIVGIDLSDQMLAIAQAKCAAFPNVTFYHTSATSIPSPDGQFDVVVCANAFHYFDNPIEVLQELRRSLKPTGRLFLLDWCRDFWTCQLCDWVLTWIDPAHQQCYTQAELHTLIQHAGFHIQEATTIRLKLLWGLMAVSASFRDPSTDPQTDPKFSRSKFSGSFFEI